MIRIEFIMRGKITRMFILFESDVATISTQYLR